MDVATASLVTAENLFDLLPVSLLMYFPVASVTKRFSEKVLSWSAGFTLDLKKHHPGMSDPADPHPKSPVGRCRT